MLYACYLILGERINETGFSLFVEAYFVVPVMANRYERALTLEEANKALLAIREKQRPVVDKNSCSQAGKPFSLSNVESLPSHLGWGNSKITAVLRNSQQSENRLEETAVDTNWIENLQQNAQFDLENTQESHSEPTFPETIKIHHDLAVAMLRQDLAASGRIWLLLRLIDEQGRGWVSIDEAKHLLTHANSELRVCGWRQIRNLLAKGKEIFWTRDSERIWLHGAAKVAYNLGITRISGNPVHIPVSALTNSISDTKAHFYASLHSGRRRDNPISRATLAETTKVPARTQLQYEAKTGIQKTRNIAVGEKLNKEKLEERAWKHGRSIFTFTDHKGMQGKPQRKYIAWGLPNSYRGSHELAPKGRMRKINQELKDLVNKRAQGNDRVMDYRVFYPDGAEAVKAYNRHSAADKDYYWQSGKAQKRPSALWGVITTQR